MTSMPEGRKRQLRRMFAHLGYRVLALKRIRKGNLSLGKLQEGETRQLSAQEVQTSLSNKPYQVKYSSLILGVVSK